MDITQMIAPIGTAVLSITAVSAFVSKYITKVVKYTLIAKDAITALDDVLESLEDGALAPAEIDRIKADVVKFKDDLKK